MSKEFPKMLYKDGEKPMIVNTQKDQDEAQGYSETPIPVEATEKDKGATFAHGQANPTKEEKNEDQPQKVEVVNSTAKDGADSSKGTDASKGLK